MKSLFTIGYEGRIIEEFVDTLKQHSIDCLLDVREIPLSRKKGFSKSVLGRFLGENNIQYIHFRQLGSPKTIREKYKADQNFPAFASRMNAYLDTQKNVLKNIFEYINSANCCLMCFERDAKQCHRSLVADKISASITNPIAVKNI